MCVRRLVGDLVGPLRVQEGGLDLHSPIPSLRIM
jgi:hypothetical protein